MFKEKFTSEFCLDIVDMTIWQLYEIQEIRDIEMCSLHQTADLA